MRRYLILLTGILFSLCASAQTKIKLSAIKAGTERVQFIPNGDFQFQGQVSGSSYPFPTGWNRSGDIYAAGGSNIVNINASVVAQAQVNNGAPVSSYSQSCTLEPATAYVFSAYLWNMGDSANHVNTVIDFNDAPGEPQIVLSATEADADKGYFVYKSFNSGVTGTNITVRAFYDGLTGTGTASAYFPVAAQWDNIAITKAASFVAPLPNNSMATLRPQVAIINPLNRSSPYVNNLSEGLSVAANAVDYDGTITNVQFFAGMNEIGERSGSPWTVLWTNATSGSYILTAVAADNTGATTQSAPVTILLTASPSTPALHINQSNANLSLSWAAGNNALVIQYASNLNSPVFWKNLTNTVEVANNTNRITLANNGATGFFRLGPEIDPGTMKHKLLMGYQGWFTCPNDGSQPNQWVHWFRNNNPLAANATVDFWPDISELDADELFDTSMTLPGGAPARVYSAFNQKTVVRHFKWMKENHLDGVFLQRFTGELASPSFFALRNQIAVNVRAGADAYGRVFAVMYDISGQSTNTLVSTLTNDWAYLVNNLQITASPFYLRHNGTPVVAVWGFGFNDGNHLGSPEQAQQVINYFKAAGCTVMGGVPTYWRTLTGDSYANSAWTAAYRAFDVISPWSVGRYGDKAGADTFRQNLIVPDLVAAKAAGREYMPVIFPGFSWHNLNAGPLNQIPRNGGAFYWEQAYNALRSGCTMIYGAMFDEMDEGTAMFKLAPTAAELPVQGTFVPLNIDGSNLPSDWYLHLADEAGKMLRGEIPLQSAIPN